LEEAAGLRCGSRLPRSGKAMLLKRGTAIITVAAAAAVLTLPILVRGPVFFGHDTREHMEFGTQFAGQFWQGDLYPRWLPGMNYGLGSASFFIYPPFPSLVYALLQPVARVAHLDTFSLGEYLCLLASGLTAFLWMTTMAGRRVALMAAAIYMLLPYHLAIDFYWRGALSECWALAWMPLVLYFTTRAVQQKRYATAGLALTYALLIVSHLVSVFLFSALPLLLVLTIAARGRRARALLTVAGCLALGAAIAGAYLLPAIANVKYFPVSRLEIPIDASAQGNLLVYGWELLRRHGAKAGFLRAVSLATVDTTLFLALCGFVALKKGQPGRRGQVLLWLGVCPIPLLLMSGLSERLWNAFPILASAVQFPWRLDVVLCIAALPLTAFLLTDLGGLTARAKIGVLMAVVLFAATWLGGYADVVKRLAQDGNHAGTGAEGSAMNIHDGWFASWTPRGMDQASALAASARPEASFPDGRGTATVLLSKPRHIEVLTDCAACGPLVIRQLDYPKWRARLASGEPLPVEPALPQGLIAVVAPPGRQRIVVEMPRGLDEKMGDWLSGLGVLVCGWLAAFDSLKNRGSSGTFGPSESDPSAAQPAAEKP
jgi:hypothetical protein